MAGQPLRSAGHARRRTFLGLVQSSDAHLDEARCGQHCGCVEREPIGRRFIGNDALGLDWVFGISEGHDRQALARRRDTDPRSRL
jgi:hypothetical protein